MLNRPNLGLLDPDDVHDEFGPMKVSQMLDFYPQCTVLLCLQELTKIPVIQI